MNTPWTPDDWTKLENRVLLRANRSGEETLIGKEITAAARHVLRAFSNSFFLVTRFLPAAKRVQVEQIYAAVRYPDEIVDSFDGRSVWKCRLLSMWEEAYTVGLQHSTLGARLSAKVPWILAGFTGVVRSAGIPAAHYHSFLDAMRRDTQPAPFQTLDELIDNYVYGSAVVVGYFLAHVYGTTPGVSMEQAYAAASNLGIALQLTNFARDVAEDTGRGRLYIPTNILQAHGPERGAMKLAEEAESRYGSAAESVNVFAADTRAAIRACIDVYRLLNQRILRGPQAAAVRHSVPIAEKFSALPADKYWRLPLAWLGAI
jgi:phytoene synthase